MATAAGVFLTLASVNEADLAVIPVMDAAINEAIKAQFDALEKTSMSFSGQDDLSDYMV